MTKQSNASKIKDAITYKKSKNHVNIHKNENYFKVRSDHVMAIFVRRWCLTSTRINNLFKISPKFTPQHKHKHKN